MNFIWYDEDSRMIRVNILQVAQKENKKESEKIKEIEMTMNETFEKVGFKVENIQREMIEEIVRKVIEQQLGQASSPGRVVDKSGVISVKAADIKPEPFDTGKEGDKVFLTDIFSLDESPRIGAGIMEMDQTVFDWTLKYDEVDYIIDGTLEIIIDGRKIVGQKAM